MPSLLSNPVLLDEKLTYYRIVQVVCQSRLILQFMVSISGDNKM